MSAELERQQEAGLERTSVDSGWPLWMIERWKELI